MNIEIVVINIIINPMAVYGTSDITTDSTGSGSSGSLSSGSGQYVMSIDDVVYFAIVNLRISYCGV